MWYHSLDFKSFLRSIGGVLLALGMLAAVSMLPMAQVLRAEEQEQIVEENGADPDDSVGAGGSGEDGKVALDEDTNADSNQTGEGGDAGSADDGDAHVETGDAVSGVEVNNQVNTNSVDGGSETNESAASTTPDGSGDEENVNYESGIMNYGENGENNEVQAEETDPHAIETLEEGEENNTGTTTLSIDTENAATSTTDVVSAAQTGENEASSSSGTASVDSGDAFAFANMANLINSNFVGSNGAFQLLNLFGNMFGELSLSMEDGAGCSFLCFLTELFVSSHNNAYLENTIAAAASTGGNAATSTTGDVAILTGNAFAAANVINMVNTNVVGSDYLAFIMNAFGSWEGDLVLPPGSFFSAEGGSASGGERQNDTCCIGGNITAENENTGTIENNVAAAADSGDNSGSAGTGSASVATGDAGANSNVMTIANTNIFGNNFLLLYVRTGGSWSGKIFSLPSGVNIIGMDDGFIIDGFSSQLGMGGLGTGVGSTTVRNASNARIINNVSATASTGGNTATAGGNASIYTGNAYAASNVVNIANTNIIGKNWLLAIINIFGNWNGDVAFGRPDLWVGAAAEGPKPLQDGDHVEFTVTYRNNGNAPATQAEVSFDFGNNLSITNPNGGAVEGNTITWDAGTINPGHYGSFTFAAQAHSVPTGDSHAQVAASADMYEDDGNGSNNIDYLLLNLYRTPPEGFMGYDQIYARLEIAKERLGADLVYPDDEVAYKITLENKGAGYAYNVVVEDEMRNASSTVVSTQAWNLDTVYPGEKIIIDYTVRFATGTPAGIYTNYALGKWYDENGNYVDHSGHAVASVEIGVSEKIETEESNESDGAADNDAVNYESGIMNYGEEHNDTATATSMPAQMWLEGTGNDWAHTLAARNGNEISEPAESIGDHEADILEGKQPVYIKDARSLDTDLRQELNRASRNPWDPRNLLAGISFSSIGYSVIWTLLAALVIYLTTRKRGIAG